jgi:dipeptidyl aminopeptidase
VALAGILLLAGAVGILAAGSFSAPAFNKKGGKKHITMDHIFNGTFAPKTKAVAWVKEGERNSMSIGRISRSTSYAGTPSPCAAGDGVFSTQTPQGDILLEHASGNQATTVLVNASQVLDVRPSFLRALRQQQRR